MWMCICFPTAIWLHGSTCISGGGLGGMGGDNLKCSHSAEMSVWRGEELSQSDWDLAERLGRELIKRHRGGRGWKDQMLGEGEQKKKKNFSSRKKNIFGRETTENFLWSNSQHLTTGEKSFVHKWAAKYCLPKWLHGKLLCKYNADLFEIIIIMN